MLHFPPPGPGDETGQHIDLLAAGSAGEGAALERLLQLVFGELETIARQVFRSACGDCLRQPTAVAHEAFSSSLAAQGRGASSATAPFFPVASQAMRQGVLDHARARFPGARLLGARAGAHARAARTER